MSTSSTRRVAKNTAVQVIADAVGKIGIVVLYVAIGRALGVDALGVIVLAASMSTFLEIAGMGTDVIIMRDVARGASRIDDLYWNSIALKIAMGAAICGIIGLVVLLGPYSADVAQVAGLLSLAGMTDQMVKTPAAVLRGREEMIPVAWSLLAQRVVTTIVGATALALGADVVVVSAGYLVGSIAAAVVVAVAMSRIELQPARRVRRAGAVALLVEGLPLGIGTVLGAVLARADAIILSLQASETAVGLYGAAYRLYEGSFFLSWAVATAVFPMLAREDARAKASFVAALRVMFTGLLPFGMLMVLFSGSVARLVFGSAFDGASGSVAWLGAATVLFAIGTIGTFTLGARGASRSILVISAVVAVVNIALNLVLIPVYGATGAAAAMAASQVLVTALSLRRVSSLLGRLGLVRAFAIPALAAVPMGLVRLALGDGVGGLFVAALAFATALAALQLLLEPAESRTLIARARAVVAARRSAT